jgi:tetratricopeptide (TPR) repeat protein
VTHPTSERHGPEHAAFLQGFAGDSPATALEARFAQGAFLVLRLVDVLGPDRAPVRPDVFHYQHAATDRFCHALPGDCTETSHLSGLVRAARHAFQGEDVRLVVPALLAYAHYLEDELRLEAALDVLETLLVVGAKQLPPSDAIAAHLRIGRVNRKLSRFDSADAAYAVAGELAVARGDVHSALLSRVGRAIAVQTRGNLGEAERTLRELSADAQAAAEQDIEARAQHTLGTTLLLRGQIAEAIVHVWHAVELYEDESSQVRALNDLGVMLLALGRVDDAERALGEVVRRDGARDNVANSLIELMHCASYRGDRVNFERRRADCEARTREMPPNILADFYFKAGIGSARFGNLAKARALMAEALSIARNNRLHESEFRIERTMAGLRDCGAELGPNLYEIAEPAIRSEALEEVSASLANFDAEGA